MKIIDSESLSEKIAAAYHSANINTRQEVADFFSSVTSGNPLEEMIINTIEENASIASGCSIPLCQDTGIPIVFIEMPADYCLSGDIEALTDSALHKITCRKGLRNSTVNSQISGQRSELFNKAEIHIIPSDLPHMRVTVLVKGGGSENASVMKMMNLSSDKDDIADFVIEQIRATGADACPPYIMGVGIGGSSEQSALSAKMALTGQFNDNESEDENYIAGEIITRGNKLNIGIQGMGMGDTVMDARVKIIPSHIATLAVSVAFGCFQHRMEAFEL
ncbi:MAG: fumarate hydratase [bacterium]